MGVTGGDNPLADGSSRGWDRAIELVGPASLLVVIRARLGTGLARKVTPEDVLQDVLLKAWERRGAIEWRGVQAFRSWLLTLIDHTIADAADHFAALKRGGPGIGAEPEHGGDGRGGRGVDPHFRTDGPLVSTTPSRLAVYREQAEAMQRALETVPDDCREVLRLRLFEELTSGEIAARLQIGESAVRHRFRRGVEAYRRALERLLSSRTRRTLVGARTGPGDSAPSVG